MTVKALSFLALSIFLASAPAIYCWQAANSYSADGSLAAYKQDVDNCSISRSQISSPAATATRAVKARPPELVNRAAKGAAPARQAARVGEPRFKSLVPVIDGPEDKSAVSASQSGPQPDLALAYKGLTPDTVMAALRACRFAALDRGADVRFEGDTLCLAVWMRRPASEHSLRIDAVLLAQAIEQHFPGVFKTVDCSFYDCAQPDMACRARINLAVLGEYGRGKLTDERLLKAVAVDSPHRQTIGELYRGVDYKEILEQSVSASGAYGNERKEILDQLTTMAANGYDVGQATRQFLALEDLVRTRQYSRISQALLHTRQALAQSAARAGGVSLASSRRINWQR